MNKWILRKQLESFFQEDIGDGDKTTEFLMEEDRIIEGAFIAKEAGLFAGGQILLEGYFLLDPAIEVQLIKRDGDLVHKGEKIAVVKGSNQALLTGERVLLNLMQRMSGIATLTNKAVKQLDNASIKICDTRKTTPGLRMLEKYAVTCGGGFNHRHGLYDAVMIKDNHITAIGSVTKAVEQVRKKAGHMIKIEVEVENEKQLMEAIQAKADIIMLDNQTPEQIKQWAGRIPESIIVEASGNITLDNIEKYGDTGVDCISLGFITHSATALDISFRLLGESK